MVSFKMFLLFFAIFISNFKYSYTKESDLGTPDPTQYPD